MRVCGLSVPTPSVCICSFSKYVLSAGFVHSAVLVAGKQAWSMLSSTRDIL